MTAKREAYLANCSDTENFLRTMIGKYKYFIKTCKALLNSGYNYPSRESDKYDLKIFKYHLRMFQHELNYLKGVDRVVAPKNAFKGAWGFKGGLCKCGKYITNNISFCPVCGRRILFEKVSKWT